MFNLKAFRHISQRCKYQIILKTPQEIEIMQEGGKITAGIMIELLNMAEVGIRTLDLEQKAEQLIKKHQVKSAFKGFQGYKYNLVTCLNEEIVHGLPSQRKLKRGDLLTLDFGVRHKGFYTDMAETKIIGNEQDQKNFDFLEVGRKALGKAIDQCFPDKRLGDVSHAVQSIIEQSGSSVIRAYVGHGIGESLHEPPQIPGFGTVGEGVSLKNGMTLAIEVMYSVGSYEVEVLEDGWTVVTADRLPSAMFEHTVVIAEGRPIIITRP